MKTMTCRQLGGACDLEFRAGSFEEVAALSQAHGAEMFQEGDEDHIKAMQSMQVLMKSPDKMNEWFESKRKEFEELPGDS